MTWFNQLQAMQLQAAAVDAAVAYIDEKKKRAAGLIGIEKARAMDAHVDAVIDSLVQKRVK